MANRFLTHEFVVLPKPRHPPKSNAANTYRNIDVLTETQQYQSLKTIRETENQYASLIRPPAQPQSTANLDHLGIYSGVRSNSDDPVSVRKKPQSNIVAADRPPITLHSPRDEKKTNSSSTKGATQLKIKDKCTPVILRSEAQVLKQTESEQDGKGCSKHHLHQCICKKHKTTMLAIPLCILVVIIVFALTLTVTGLISATDGESKLKSKYDQLQQQFKELQEAMNSSLSTLDETLHNLSTNFQRNLIEEHSFLLNIIENNKNHIGLLSEHLTANIALLTMKIEELTADVSSIKDNASGLSNSVATLLGSIDTLNIRINGVNRRISNLRVKPFNNCVTERKVSLVSILNTTYYSYTFSTPLYGVNKLVSYLMKQK